MESKNVSNGKVVHDLSYRNREWKVGCNGKVVHSLRDRDRELKSGCKGNSGWNDRDMELKSAIKVIQFLS